MKQSEIVKGGLYTAKVSGRLVTVRVDAIRETPGYRSGSRPIKAGTAYDVTNLSTGRRTTFRSAAKFRGVASAPKPKNNGGLSVGPLGGLTAEPSGEYAQLETDALEAQDEVEAEQRPDPTSSASTSMIPDGALDSTMPSDAELTEMAREDREEEALAGRGYYSPVTAKLAALSERLAVPVPAVEPGTLSLTGDGRTLTAEQAAILKLAREVHTRKGKGRVIVIKAGAGAGKTYECQQLEMVLDTTFQYTAFNKSLVEDSRSKFKRAAVNTTYSLAFKECGRLYAHRLKGNRVRSDQIARMLGIEGMHVTLQELDEHGEPRTKWLNLGFLAGQCIVAVRRFCQSADREIGEEHFGYIDGIDSAVERDDGSKRRGHDNNDQVKKHLLDAACRLWADLSNPEGVIPIPSLMHGVYFKVWQLGSPVISAQVILLDEYQDTAPVLVDVLRQQVERGSMLILVGDDNQRIYEWLGAVNAGDEFPEAETANLSQSFRFGQAIADVANTVLATLEEPTDLRMQGFDRIPSRVCKVPEPKCFLFRTNAGAVGRVMRAIGEGKRPHLVGGGADVVAFCKAAIQLQAQQPTDHPELCCFTSWTEVEEYSKTDEGEDLALMVKLINAFGAEEIRDALEHMPEERDADLICCTAHKSKGREWASVKVGQDFPTKKRMTDSDRRLLYVAATRAQEELDVSECPPFCGGVELLRDEDGEVEGEEKVEGLRITWTTEMPTQEQLAAYRAEKGVEAVTEAVKDLTDHLQSQKEAAPKQRADNTVLIANGGEDFTWASIDGQWLIRGAKGMEGQTVTVTRRNGSTSKETLRKAVKKLGDLWFYSNR